MKHLKTFEEGGIYATWKSKTIHPWQPDPHFIYSENISIEDFVKKFVDNLIKSNKQRITQKEKYHIIKVTKKYNI